MRTLRRGEIGAPLFQTVSTGFTLASVELGQLALHHHGYMPPYDIFFVSVYVPVFMVPLFGIFYFQRTRFVPSERSVAIREALQLRSLPPDVNAAEWTPLLVASRRTMRRRTWIVTTFYLLWTGVALWCAFQVGPPVLFVAIATGAIVLLLVTVTLNVSSSRRVGIVLEQLQAQPGSGTYPTPGDG